MATQTELDAASSELAYLTAGMDVQIAHYEMHVWCWGPGDESRLINKQIIMGRHDHGITRGEE